MAAIAIKVFFEGDKTYVVEADSKLEAEKLALERFSNEYDLQPYVEDVWIKREGKSHTVTSQEFWEGYRRAGQAATQPPAPTDKGDEALVNHIPKCNKMCRNEKQLRDEFAIAALLKLVTTGKNGLHPNNSMFDWVYEAAAREAYKFADAMMKERLK